MIDKPTIVESEPRDAAIIRFTIPREKIQEVMGSGITEVMNTVSSQGIGPAGPIYSHHHKMDPATFDFEIGVPVNGPVTEAGRVKAGQLPAAKVARTIYRGGYEGLGAAWGEFDAWIKAEGLTPAANLWEFYVKGPESGDDSSKWETELNRPLA